MNIALSLRSVFFLFSWMSFFALNGASQPYGYPKPTDKYINDFAHAMSPNIAQTLREKLESIDKQTGIEISVVIINSIKDFSGTPSNFEQFATSLFNRWKIGKTILRNTFLFNNGILLLVAIKDRAVRIELGSGYHQDCDGKAQKIIDDTILPRFREGNYRLGINDGVGVIIANLAHTESTGIEPNHTWVVGILMLVALVMGIGYFSSCQTTTSSSSTHTRGHVPRGSYGKSFSASRSPASRPSGRGASGRW